MHELVKLIIYYLILVFIFLMAGFTLANAQGRYGESYTPPTEITLGEVTDEYIEINWVNLVTPTARNTETMTFETRHGNVTISITRTPNRYDMNGNVTPESADIIDILDWPDGWVSALGFTITMPENQSGSFRIIKWNGT